MSLQEEIESILANTGYPYGIGIPPNENITNEAINRVLDAAVESLKNEADQMAPGFEYDRGIHDAHKIEAPRIINKLRPKS